MHHKVQINNRIRDILSLLYYRTWASSEDIYSLYFSNLKYCRRLMRKLIERKWVKCIQCPVASNKGPGLNFYALLKKGHNQILNGFFKETTTPTSVHLLHYYIKNLFLTGFKIIAKEHPGFYVQEMTEKELKEHNSFYNYFNSTCNNQVEFAIPDFILCLGDDENKQLFLGEVDTCTETLTSSNTSLKTIEKKFETFNAYENLGIHQYFSKHFDFDFQGFTYLHITTGGDDRVNRLTSICRKHNFHNALITKTDFLYPHRTSIKQRLSYDNLIKPVWVLAGDKSEKRYSIIG